MHKLSIMRAERARNIPDERVKKKSQVSLSHFDLNEIKLIPRRVDGTPLENVNTDMGLSA